MLRRTLLVMNLSAFSFVAHAAKAAPAKPVAAPIATPDAQPAVKNKL